MVAETIRYRNNASAPGVKLCRHKRIKTKDDDHDSMDIMIAMMVLVEIDFGGMLYY